MFGFREFDAGPDPFGRKYAVALKWLQTAISVRGADAVDVKFVLADDSGAKMERTVALPHAALREVCAQTARAMDDAWCGRLARLRLERMIRTGEDLEKSIVTVPAAELRRLAGELAAIERAEAPKP